MYNGLLSCFAVKNSNARRRCAYGSFTQGDAEIRQGLTTLNSNNFVVYDQKHKVWVILFLVRTS